MTSNNPITRFRLPVEYHYQTKITGIEYFSEHIEIRPDGRITIFNGACSDGMSPTYHLPFIGTVGPPNGPLRSDGMPVTAPAFYLHDHLLDHRALAGIDIDLIHEAFCIEIMKTNYRYRRLACWAVRRFGPR